MALRPGSGMTAPYSGQLVDYASAQTSVGTYISLFVAIVSEVIATMLLKACDGWNRWQYGIASLVCYAVAGALLSFVLQKLSVGVAYGIWAGSGIALICLASALLWNQSLDLPALSGIAFIVAGILLITLKSGVVLH